VQKIPICPRCHSGFLTQLSDYVTFKCPNCKSVFNLSEIFNFKKHGEKIKICPTARIVNSENLELGNNVIIGDFCFINAGKRTSIGNNSQLNAYSSIIGGGETYILDNVCISYYAMILSGTDTPQGKYMVDAYPLSQRKVIRGKITLEPNVFVGAHAIVTVSKKDSNILIGRNSVLGANSYIDTSIPPNTIVIPKQKLTFKKR